MIWQTSMCVKPNSISAQTPHCKKRHILLSGNSLIKEHASLSGKVITNELLSSVDSIKNKKICVLNTSRNGSVGNMLKSWVALLKSVDITVEWFSIADGQLLSLSMMLYHSILNKDIEFNDVERHQNLALRATKHIDFKHYDIVIIHDHQLMPIVRGITGPILIWHCHLDYSFAHEQTLRLVQHYASYFHHLVFASSHLGQFFHSSKHIITPFIDPLSESNKEMSLHKAKNYLRQYGIPTDKPIITNISRLSYSKNLREVLDSVAAIEDKIPARLVMLTTMIDDDMVDEFTAVKKIICQALKSTRNIIFNENGHDPFLINALNTVSIAALSCSRNESFGLTITEAMWKNTVCIGFNYGGIAKQIEHEVSGFLANSREEYAGLLEYVLMNKDALNHIVKTGKSQVKNRYLLMTYFKKYLHLLKYV